LTKPKPPTPTKGLLIRSQKNFRKSEKGNDLQVEKDEKKNLTKTMTGNVQVKLVEIKIFL